MVNNAAAYGIPADLALDIANSAHASASIIRTSYDAYVAQGMPFASWNDPATSTDETFGTFITLARQFIAHADNARSFVVPLTRTMRLLRTFNASIFAQYAPQSTTVAASTFRSTLMVAALSYGFQQDLRAEFRALRFPIDDAAYTTLYNSIHEHARVWRARHPVACQEDLRPECPLRVGEAAGGPSVTPPQKDRDEVDPPFNANAN